MRLRAMKISVKCTVNTNNFLILKYNYLEWSRIDEIKRTMPYKLDSFDKQIERKNGIDPQRLISETSSRVKSSFAPWFGPRREQIAVDMRGALVTFFLLFHRSRRRSRPRCIYFQRVLPTRPTYQSYGCMRMETAKVSFSSVWKYRSRKVILPPGRRDYQSVFLFFSEESQHYGQNMFKQM